MDMMQCPLHHLGCTGSFPRNQLFEHYSSEKHRKTMVEYICSEGIKCDNALIDLTVLTSETDESSISLANLVDSYRRLAGGVTNVIVQNAAQPNLMHAAAAAASNGSLNLNRIYSGIESPSRALIEQMDRDPNYEHNLSSHQAELGLNTAAMNNLSNSIPTSSTGDSVNHHMGQNQGPTHAIEQQNIAQFHELSNGILQTELDSKSVSTDGRLIWHIDGVSKKTEKPFIDSSPFQTVMNGHRLWARLSLNGTTNPRYISLHVHLNSPVKDSFRGRINFILVDQSSNKPLQHIKKCCTGEMTDVNDRLGFDDFIDINFLRQEKDRYVLNDSIYLLVDIEQTIEQKLANLPENIRDALMLI